MSTALASHGEGPLAIVCGGGSLPLAVADFAAARGRSVHLFPIYGAARPSDYAARSPQWLYLGQFGKFARLARAAGCQDIVFIGSLVRPAFWQVRPDLRTLMALPRVIGAFRGGDNHLLTSLGRLIEENGFRVHGAHEVAPEILMPSGTLGRVAVPDATQADMAFGLDYLRTAGHFDIGQAVVVADRHILAVEAIEGTDAMLARIAQLRADGRIRTKAKAVLVKAAKPSQDKRFDLPSIGPRTVEGVVKAGVGGIAVVAGESIVAEPGELVEAADRAGIFVTGLPAGNAP